MLKLDRVYVKGVKADMVKGEVTLSFTMALDDQAIKARRLLTLLAIEETACGLTIDDHPQQMSLLADDKSTTTLESSLHPGVVYDFDKVTEAMNITGRPQP